MAAAAELDDILASALDDFEDDEAEAKEARRAEKARKMAMAKLKNSGKAVAVEEPPKQMTRAQRRTIKAAAAVSAKDKDSDAMAQAKKERQEETIESLTKLIGGMNDPDFSKTIEEALASMETQDDGKTGDPNDAFKGKNVDPKISEPMIDANIAKTLQMLSEAGKTGIDGMEPAAAEALGEELMQKIMGDFERIGEKDDFQNVVDGMMKQLLSKEIMYEPIKAICEKYPEWLAENEPQLSTEEYERFGTQYQYIQRICACYETQPDNFPRLMELMQDMQECGQPPAEIVKELAPGLKFDKDGMPVMPDMGPGFPKMPPTDMPNVPGMNQQCSVM